MSKKVFIILTFAFVLGLLTDIYIFINRHDGYDCYFVDYETLYYLDDIPAITGFEIDQDNRLTVKFDRTLARGWLVTIDNRDSHLVNSEMASFPLIPDIHVYSLKPIAANSNVENEIILKIAYSPSEVYQAAGNPTGDAVHVIQSSLPIGCHQRYNKDDFVYQTDFYTDSDIERGRAILDSIGVATCDNSESRIMKIGRFLIESLGDRGGIPDGRMASLSPLVQYQWAMTGTSRVWCKNYQEIYIFFATLAGVPTRAGGTTGSLDGVLLSGHSFAESYIGERWQWAYVDPSSGKILIRNETGDFMNTLDLYHAVLSGNLGCLTTTILQDSILLEVPYDQAAEVEKYYFARDAMFAFPLSAKNPRSLFSRIRRYLYEPDPVYSLYGSNAKFHTKMVLLILTALITIAVILMTVFFIRK